MALCLIMEMHTAISRTFVRKLKTIHSTCRDCCVHFSDNLSRNSCTYTCTEFTWDFILNGVNLFRDTHELNCICLYIYGLLLYYNLLNNYCYSTIFNQILFIVTGDAGNEEDVQDFLNGTLIEDEITGSNSTAQVLSVKLRDSINQLSAKLEKLVEG